MLRIPGKTVIDFGCGLGYQCVAFVQAGAARVIGVEIDQPLLLLAREKVARQQLEDRVELVQHLPPGTQADVIVSQNSFEHFLDAQSTLEELRTALAPQGRIYLTFAPPWYAPAGAHMGFFCRLPWVQLLFPESAVMEARKRFRADGALTYKEAGLAQMSVERFETIVAASQLRIRMRRYDCARMLNFLGHVPVIRELFINRVSCVLTH